MAPEWIERALEKAAEWRRKKDQQRRFSESSGSKGIPAVRDSNGHYEYVRPSGGATLVNRPEATPTPAPTSTHPERHSRITDWELDNDK